jgi:hypothetical protein
MDSKLYAEFLLSYSHGIIALRLSRDEACAA